MTTTPQTATEFEQNVNTPQDSTATPIPASTSSAPAWLALISPALREKLTAEQPALLELSLDALLERLLAQLNTAQKPLKDVACAKDYQLSCPEHARAWYDQDFADVIAQSLYDAGLSKEQAAALHQSFVAKMHQRWMDTQSEAEFTQQQELLAHEQALDAMLDKHWGKARARKEQQVKTALRVLGFEADALDALLTLGDPLQTLDLLVRLGEANDEEALFPQGDTPLDPKSQLQSLSADPNHRNAFLDPTHPAHERAKALRARLIKQALSQA